MMVLITGSELQSSSIMKGTHHIHVALTASSEVGQTAFRNEALVLALFYDAVATTLKTIAADPRNIDSGNGVWP